MAITSLCYFCSEDSTIYTIMFFSGIEIANRNYSKQEISDSKTKLN